MVLKNRYINVPGLLLAFSLLLMPAFGFADTPKEILAKAKNKLSAAKTVTADFTMTANGQTVKGNLTSKGTKFALVSNVSSNWYNGKDLYTYNNAQKETTVFKPTSSELAEVNPLLYLNLADGFNVQGTKAKKSGMETVVLIPKKTGSGVKSVMIDIDSKTFYPRSIKITPSSGQPLTIAITGLKTDVNVPDSKFEYPKDKYKNVTITDMR